MDKTDQRIALAKARGWTDIEWYSDNAGPDLLCGKPPADFKETFRKEHKYGCCIPEITLDEMFLVEEEMMAQGINHYRAYVSILHRVMSKDRGDPSILVHATAWQKCEAVLRILDEWKE